jgi:hypothetical protein
VVAFASVTVARLRSNGAAWNCIAFSFLLCLQDCRAFGFLGRNASVGLLSFTRCLVSKLKFAGNLRG